MSCDISSSIKSKNFVGMAEPRSGVQVKIDPEKRETIHKNDDAVINYQKE